MAEEGTGGKQDPGAADLETGAEGQSSPPEEDLEYEGEVFEDDLGQRMVPLDAVLDERRKRQELEGRLNKGQGQNQGQGQSQEPPPDFNWDLLQQALQEQQGQQGGQQGQQPQVSPDEWNDRFREMYDENPWGAMMTAFGMFNDHRERMRNQARKFVPDYDNLPVYDVSDQEVMALMQNPDAVRGLIAKSKFRNRRTGARSSDFEDFGQTEPELTPAEKERQRLIDEGRRMEREAIMKMGSGAGMSGESPSSGGQARSGRGGAQVDLDEQSKNYFRARGYTDEEITKMAPRIIAMRQKRRGY